MLKFGRVALAKEETHAVGEWHRLDQPGVQSVGTVQTLPLRGGGYRSEFRVSERPDIEVTATEYRIVTPGYLESIGIALRRGRTITDTDRRDTERVVVINEALAQKYFAGVDLGRNPSAPEPGDVCRVELSQAWRNQLPRSAAQ